MINPNPSNPILVSTNQPKSIEGGTATFNDGGMMNAMKTATYTAMGIGVIYIAVTIGGTIATVYALSKVFSKR